MLWKRRIWKCRGVFFLLFHHTWSHPFFVIVRAPFMFPMMVFRHLQRLHKGKYIDTLIFGTFFREPLSIAPPSLIFASIVLHNGKISPKIIGSLDPLWTRDLERFFQIHISKLKSFVDLFTRTLDWATQWQDGSLPSQPFSPINQPMIIHPCVLFTPFTQRKHK